ncbi:hypothetical protein Tco_1410202 [Tanacetum coccineum]
MVLRKTIVKWDKEARILSTLYETTPNLARGIIGESIVLPVGNNVGTLRSTPSVGAKPGCFFHALVRGSRNQHLNDFLKLVDFNLTLTVENREERAALFSIFSSAIQALAIGLRRLPAGSFTIWVASFYRFLA